MKFRIGKIFAEFGRSPDQRNLVEIRSSEGTGCRVLIGLLAESFDSALSFYIDLSERMMADSNSNVVELTGRNVRQVCKELKMKPEFLSTSTAIYRQFPAHLIGRFFNASWLACSIRIIGSQANSCSDFVSHKDEDGLPPGLDFVIEKKSVGVSDFLSIRWGDSKCPDLIAFLRARSGDLKHSLVETRLPI